MSSRLDLVDLYHAYDTDDVVRGVSLSVEEGEIVCILGPSGCGKTTCLRIAAGLERPRAGEVRIGDSTVAGPGRFVPPEKRRVGLVLQDYALFPDKTVLKNVTFGMQGVGRDEQLRRARTLLDAVGLTDLAAAYPHQLSGGQQQRVALVRALAPEPLVMLMDEPFSSLDVTLRGAVREETARLLKARSVPTLMVTHDPDEALQMADRIAIMRAGRIIQVGTAEDCYTHPADPFVMAFFGQPNRLAGTVSDGQVDTIFGPVTTDDLEEGAEADILFRSTALKPNAGGGLSASIVDARLLGPIERLELQIDGLDQPLRMDRLRGEGPSVGQPVTVSADLSAFHVFAKTSE